MSFQKQNLYPQNSETTDSFFPVLLVVAAVLFNAGLAIVNASVMGLGSKHVILSEILIVGLSQYYALTHFHKKMTPWFLFMVAVGLFTVLRMVVVGEVQVKYFRDLLLIQTFIVLGMATPQHRVIQAFMIILVIVVLGILLEAASLKSFSNLFEIKQYYINTRGMVSDDFTAKGSKLFVSATRPGARHLPFFGLHRLSSIFLESVSLGNFVIIMVCFILAFWSKLDIKTRIFMVLATLLCLFASDGRLALFGSLIILGMAMISHFFPRNIALFILPMIIVLSVLIFQIGDLHSGKDNFSGRLAYTIELLLKMDFSDYFGISNRLLDHSADSGIIYLMLTHSVVLVAIWWVLMVTELEESSAAQRHYKNGISLYLALTMLVSFSFISIKTAAPLWLVYGALAVSGAERRKPFNHDEASSDEDRLTLPH